MKSIRVLLTDKCNEHCVNCINKSIRSESAFMDSRKLIRLSHYLRENGVERIRVMGGEPTLHPEFTQITEQLQCIFQRVTVFTNGTTDNICSFVPRECDAINYNSKFLKCIDSKRLLNDKPGARVISVVITKNIDIESLKIEIKQILNYCNRIRISLTLDCNANIFKDKKILIHNYKSLYNYCVGLGLETIMDHNLPICFLYGTDIVINRPHALCDIDCSGLIDAHFNLRFCNIASDQNLQLFGKDDRIVPFKIVSNFLQIAFYERQISVLNKLYKECTLYGDYCNGGCFLHNKNITRADVLHNTDFPTKR